jgi:tetratricopeptide (TPR) repeat protein
MSGSARNVVQAAHIGSVTFVEPGMSPAVPAQAEPPPSAFVDRDEQLALLRARAAVTDRSRPEVFAVRGMQGVGKTALLRQFAATSRDLFPDGVLSVTFEPQERAPSEAAARLLLGLGVPEQRIPSTFARRVALYRSMSAGLRLLVLLDDVTEAEQVSALLPNSPASMVLAAGNRVLEELYVEGATDLALRPLPVDDGIRLLREVCGAARVAAEPDAVRALVETYEGLPLAIRVAGARLAARPGWPVGRLVDELREAGAGPVETKVFATFDRVYDDLSSGLRSLYRVLGVMVGARFGAEVLAAVTERPVRYVRADLDELVQAGLVEDDGTGAHRLHRLVRRHALHRSVEEDDDQERRALRQRAVRWWLFGAMTADLAADPDRLRVPDPDSVRGVRSPEVSAAAGLDWLDREHANLLDVMEAAADEGWHAEVCRLFEALFALYKTRKPLSAWVRAGKLAVTSAVATGRPETEARCRCLLAKAFQELERFDDAHAELARARELVADGPERFTASTYDFTGNLCLRRGDPEAALGWFDQALAINRRLGLERGTALQSTLAARALSELGRQDEALELLATARDLVTGGSAAALLPKILATTGAVLTAAGEPEAAARTLIEAVEQADALGNTADAVDALLMLARSGAPEADGYRQRAIQLLERMGSPRAARLLAGAD